MEAERVIEAAQQDAAQEAASHVAAEVAGEAAVISGQVAAVEEELIDHAEASEERHEEILEGQAWQQQQFANLTNNLTNHQTQTAALLAAMQTQLSSLGQLVTEALSQRSQSNSASPDSMSSSPESQPVVAVVVEPESAADQRAANQPPTETSSGRRKVRRI